MPKNMKLNFIIILIFLDQIFYCVNLQGQKWFFPSSTLFDVNSESISNNDSFKFPPFLEGHIIIFNSKNDLLFYSDGVSIWDRNHNLFPSSQRIPLLQNSSSVQGAYCIKSSKDENIYFLLSLNHIAVPSNGELYISQIDLRLNNGLGDIVDGSVVKVGDNFTEQMEVIPNPCGGVWVINHQRDNNSFEATHILDGKVIEKVISKVGNNSLRSRWFLGGLKASKDKSRLIWVETGGKPIEIFDFDQTSGKLSEKLEISETDDFTFGVFSEDGNLIYVAKRDEKNNKNFIIQYDITQSSVELIKESKTIFEVPVDLYPSMIGMEYNKKNELVFTSSSHSSHIGKILYPNEKGITCIFNPNAILIPNRHLTKMFAHPLIIEPSNNIDILQKNYNSCKFSLTLETKTKLDSVHWSTGGKSEEILVNTPGIYSVKAYKDGCLYYDTTSISFNIPFKKDSINICGGKSFKYKNKEYYEGETIRDTIYNVMCDTIVEIFIQNSTSTPQKYASKAICPETEYEHIDGMKYKIGDTIITVASANLGQCDTIVYTKIVSLPISNVTILGNNQICFGEKTELRVTPNGLNYTWSTGEKTEKINVGAGRYDVIHTDSFNCVKEAAITVSERTVWEINMADTFEISNMFPKDIGILGDYKRILSVDVSPPDENIKWQSDKIIINSKPSIKEQKLIFRDSIGCTTTHTLYYDFKQKELSKSSNVIYLNSDISINREWKINLEPGVELKEVIIYDRYGSVVYKSSDPIQTWDGRVNGQEVQEGIYIIKVESLDSKGRISHQFKELLVLR